MKTALDTNIIIYALDTDAGERGTFARRLLAAAADERALLPLQVAGETFNVLTRRRGWAIADAHAVVTRLLGEFASAVATEAIVRSGMRLAELHQLAYWDALVLATVAANSSDLLLSEDMQDGRAFSSADTGSGRVTVVNPFAAANLPLLHAALPGLRAAP